MVAVAAGRQYMTRESMPVRRHTWRQKVIIHDPDSGAHTFYVEFGEYPDGRLGEVWVTSHRVGTFARGTMDALARTASLALQSGTSPSEVAKTLRGMEFPPAGRVESLGTDVETCTSIIDYIGQEIAANYGPDGRRLERPPVQPPPQPDQQGAGTPRKVAGYAPESWRTGI